MKGNNELHINQSTMIEAMQFYIAEKLKLENTFVREVKKNENERGYPDCFIIAIGDKMEVTEP